MHNDLVSIITPTWNCGRFIEETIRSVQAQTYTNWEMIIADDCSTDNTREVIAPYLAQDKRIRYICNDKNSGAAVTRNYALREAKGRWIAFLDSDDLWMPEKLERQIRFMEENGYSFSGTECIDFIDGGTIVDKKDLYPRHIGQFGMKSYCWVGCLCAMYDANVVGVVQIEDLKKNNDYAIWLKAIKKADCYSLNEVLALYRVRERSISHVGSKSKLIKHHYTLWRDGEKMGAVTSIALTGLNIVCYIIKKLFFKKALNAKERANIVAFYEKMKQNNK